MTLRARKTHLFYEPDSSCWKQDKTFTDHHHNFEAALKATGSKAMFVLH